MGQFPSHSLDSSAPLSPHRSPSAPATQRARFEVDVGEVLKGTDHEVSAHPKPILGG